MTGQQTDSEPIFSFDIFGDAATRGYLRIIGATNIRSELRMLERRSYLANRRDAVDMLDAQPNITYRHVLDTHRILFADVYPTWAGTPRTIAVGIVDVVFCPPEDIEAFAQDTLGKAGDRREMLTNPGAIFVDLAHIHPFLDGNGRTLTTVHTVLAERAGITIRWDQIDRAVFLGALTHDLTNRGDNMVETVIAGHVPLATNTRSQAAQSIDTQLDNTFPGISGDDQPQGIFLKPLAQHLASNRRNYPDDPTLNGIRTGVITHLPLRATVRVLHTHRIDPDPIFTSHQTKAMRELGYRIGQELPAPDRDRSR